MLSTATSTVTATTSSNLLGLVADRLQGWFAIALLNFLLAASLGALLRLAFIIEIPFVDFRHVLHAHSHVAMLGWIYLALFALLVHRFVPLDKQAAPYYRWLFWLTQFSVVGMLVSFPIQGYDTWSILFSSIHIILSYAFAWRLWRDARPQDGQKASPAYTMLRLALVFMVFSTLGIWAMPVVVNFPKIGSAFYYGSIQFFLHFQFNGWFVFAGLALLFQMIEASGKKIDLQQFKWFCLSLVSSCVLTYALAVAWSTPWPVIFYTNSLGVVLQLIAVYFLLRLFYPRWENLSASLSKPVRALLLFAMFCFVFKMVIQFAVVVPAFATIAYTIRNFVIGFIHLLMLGMMSSLLLSLALNFRIFELPYRHQRTGLYIFVTGVILSESVLFGQGILLWLNIGFFPGYYETLFAVSILMPIGILLMLIDAVGKMANPDLAESSAFVES